MRGGVPSEQPLSKMISFVLPALKVTFHRVAQLDILARSRFSVATVSKVELAVAIRDVSSAKM